MNARRLTRRVFGWTLKPVYTFLRHWVTYLLFERSSRIDTSAVIELEKLGLADPERIRYKASGWLSLRRVLAKSEVSPEDVFLDVGSGMGRVVYLAALYPFKRVIGVELSPELHEIAVANVEVNRDRLRCKNIELVNGDVLDYEVADDVTVVYMNNPFLGSIFAEFVRKLVASVDRNPRQVRIIYGNPVEEEILLRTGRVRICRRSRGFRPTREWSRSNAIHMYVLR